MFSLSKWYCDCVTSAGEVFIAYNAGLRWGAVSIHYTSILEQRGSALPEVSCALRRQPPPEFGLHGCRWRCDSLRLSGEWRGVPVPAGELLYNSPEGAVNWTCGLPAAQTCIQIEGKPDLQGCGYVEHLQLTIPPWRLPIRELRWGHFMGVAENAVWIDWVGDDCTSKTLVFHNGSEQNASEIRDHRVALDHGVVELDCGLVLRDGAIGSTALSVVPGAARLFPTRILKLHETKWRSAAVLRRPGCADVSGWAIHEVVRWPAA